MLLRNIDFAQGLCNGTRLIVKKLHKHLIEAEILNGKFANKMAWIPKMPMTSDIKLPFNLKRVQFPVTLAYCISINKSQGQTIENVMMWLPEPVLTHGQLYVGASRVTSAKNLKIGLPENKEHTRNVVYKEIFNSL